MQKRGQWLVSDCNIKEIMIYPNMEQEVSQRLKTLLKIDFAKETGNEFRAKQKEILAKIEEKKLAGT